MTEIKLDKIEPIHYKNKFLYIIDDKISQISVSDEVTGQLVIQDNRIVILGPRLLTNIPNHEDQREMEA